MSEQAVGGDEDGRLLAEYAATGDERALRTLYERWAPRLLSFLTRYMGDAAAAEDALQEAFWRLARNAGRYDPSRPFPAWAWRVALNAANNILRGRRHVPLLDGAAAAAGNPADDDGDATAAVRAALSELPEYHRSVFILYFWHDLPYQDIAELLRIPVGTVKSRMHYAVRALKERLKGILEE